MKTIKAVNDFVVKFSNVNGTGSASANHMFAKAIFRMGVPISPKNIFPSNIQGLPTWYEVRVSEKGYLGRRGGVDIMVCVNQQSLKRDIEEVESGGFLIYDSSKPLDLRLMRSDINFLGVPFANICRQEYHDVRQRQLFKNVIYVGAIVALLDIDFGVLVGLIGEQFKGKENLIAHNIRALELGFQYARAHFDCPLPVHVQRCDNVGDSILMDGNTACGLGAVYGGATVAGWYPITPSTSVISAFEKYCARMRIDPASGEKNYACIQAEDELAAIGMVVGAGWNGARSFTATSGPGISLMSEFLGLAYFAEIPAVLINVQRAGPSTGMPTRTQQSDIMICAYASHGDTKHVCLYPSTAKECFEMTALALDLADRLQTPVIVVSDLDIGMNENMSPPLNWDDERCYDRGKVFSACDLDAMTERFGRYLDLDGDGIPSRTLPGTHPTKGAYFTRGTSRDEYAIYTESGAEYVKNMERLMSKWQTAKSLLPAPLIKESAGITNVGIIYFGSSEAATLEAVDMLAANGFVLDSMGIKAFPFNNEVEQFIHCHETIFIVEQNRDAQMRSMLIIECEVTPKKLIKVLNYDGSAITARTIETEVTKALKPTAYVEGKEINELPIKEETS